MNMLVLSIHHQALAFNFFKLHTGLKALILADLGGWSGCIIL